MVLYFSIPYKRTVWDVEANLSVLHYTPPSYSYHAVSDVDYYGEMEYDVNIVNVDPIPDEEEAFELERLVRLEVEKLMVKGGNDEC